MAQRRTDTASRLIKAAPDAIWRAWFDPALLVRWLPPPGMTAQLVDFDPRPGGAFRMELTYESAHVGPGKTTADSDSVEARFVEIVPPQFFVQDVQFVSDDAQFAGSMRMTWRFDPQEGGTRVTVVAENVPPGISAADHALGLGASLQNLADFVE